MNVKLIHKLFDVEEQPKKYEAKEIIHKYGVCYCIRYRPVGILEWILARGWWNDKGIWTEDWIFNDWEI